jgi:hypothetical protein
VVIHSSRCLLCEPAQLGVSGGPSIGRRSGDSSWVPEMRSAGGPGALIARGPPSPLFPGGPGRTTTPEDFTSLMNDLESKIFDRFDDDTVMHPGHGDDTTLGTERPHLAEWRKRAGSSPMY